MAIVRRSKKRDAMLELLRSTTCHPSADWVHRQLRQQYPDISLGTVYRNLKQLTEEGLVRSVGVIGGQERFDGCLTPHSHFICNHCGQMVDLPDCVPADAVGLLGKEYGFTAQSCEVHIYGICSDCAKRSAS